MVMLRRTLGAAREGAATVTPDTSGHVGTAGDEKQDARNRLIPSEFLRIIAVWSLIPSYLIAGGLIGYAIDRWLNVFPYLTGLGLLLAVAAAVRDMLRLRKEWD
jgi:hypothetical protein